MERIENRLFSGRQLLRLIIPLVIEQGLNILVGLADGVMVSSAGEAAISGVSLVDMINAVVLTLFMGLATGGAVVTSQYLGARKYHDAQKSVGQLILMAAESWIKMMQFTFFVMWFIRNCTQSPPVVTRMETV